ncbi:translation initiation factor eIF3 subunit g [Coemansia sp. RSA 552]|nr:translation initiation factor eIF3 subunit g [Coemansia sp. RSA 552]
MNRTDWADEVEEDVLPERQLIVNEDGTKTVIEYRKNEDGKKVKQTRRIRDKVVQEHVNRAVAERKKWAKFGEEAGSAPGPNISTTTVGEMVWLKLSQYAAQQKQQEEAAQQEKTLTAKNTHIICRKCRGFHFTAKCPYKDTLVSMEEITGDGAAPEAGAAAAGDAKTGNAYVPPHMRAGGRGPGVDMHERRDENPTIRITNLSEYTDDEDVQHLCRPFGSPARIFVARDRVTGLCKGYAFVSYYDHDAAERAIAKLNGHGFDHLILNAEWANGGR